MNHPERSSAVAASRGDAPWLRRSVVAALGIALAGSTAVGLIETALGAWHIGRQLHGGSLPLDLVLAALGRAVVTHALVWCPLLVAAAGIHFIATRRRTAASPEAALSALLVALVGLTVVPADLELGGLGRRGILIVACCIVVVAAVGVYLLLRTMQRRRRLQGLRRTMNWTAYISVAVVLVSGTVFVRSPLFNPAAYRVPKAAAEHPSGPMPNVLWIVLDTVRADRMSCYGYPERTTPFLESWAKRCLVFDRAVANGIWTLPSHASMFTGLSVREHGASHARLWLDDAIPTVAEELRAQGYATASFSNNPWIWRHTNLVQGFDDHRVLYDLWRMGRFSLEHLGRKWGITPRVPWLSTDFGAAITNQCIGRWLDDRSKAPAPLFLFVNYMDAHEPYNVPKAYREMTMTDDQVDRSYDLAQRVHGGITQALRLRFNIEGPDFLLPSDREVLRRQYDAAIRYLDDRVRELIDMFEQRGLLDRTLVVITSDHGEYLDSHGMWSHQHLTYQDVTHVGLMIREPGRREAQRVGVPVQLSDLYPTILKAALGTSPAGPGYGTRDLFALAGAAGSARVAISEYEGPIPKLVPRMLESGDPVVVHRARPQIAAQDGRFKYIASGDGQRELYDLAADPGELHNLIDTHRAEAERLAAYLDRWMQDVPRRTPTDPDAAPAMDPETIKALRSLGYLGDE